MERKMDVWGRHDHVIPNHDLHDERCTSLHVASRVERLLHGIHGRESRKRMTWTERSLISTSSASPLSSNRPAKFMRARVASSSIMRKVPAPLFPSAQPPRTPSYNFFARTASRGLRHPASVHSRHLGYNANTLPTQLLA